MNQMILERLKMNKNSVYTKRLKLTKHFCLLYKSIRFIGKTMKILTSNQVIHSNQNTFHSNLRKRSRYMILKEIYNSVNKNRYLL